MKPGQAMRFGDVVIRLRACEQTAPWEQDKLTGAFVQVDIRGIDRTWRRTFSGWLYKERPGLNVVQHPVYDVWTKSCTMSWPATGPDTSVLAAPSTARARQAPVERAEIARRCPGGRRAAPRDRGAQQRHVIGPVDLDRAQRGEVIGLELAIEQREAADAEPRDQPRQRDLGRIGPAADHRFAEECPPQRQAVQPADQLVPLPTFDRMGESVAVKRREGAFDRMVDPRVGAAVDALRAQRDRGVETRDRR